MEESIFTKIIRGEIPSHKVYEDEKTFAFLDIHPTTEGHVLVVPKVQVEFIWDLEEADYQALMRTVQKVGRRLREVLGSIYISEMTVGVDVPHAHVHVIPFYSASELTAIFSPTDTEPDHEALASLAERIKF
jgi:histidine triad (HIT) family protein